MEVEWSVLAVDDRNAIFDYIDADSPQAAAVVDDRIEEQLELLLQFPQMGRGGRIEGTRELVVQKTPYVVAYRRKGEIILVLRVLHGAQRWPEDMG
jgi:toxin ParE1/3/4